VARALLALVIIGISAYFAYAEPAKLGLDLRGGTQIVLETRDSPHAKATSASTDRALEVLRKRVDALGVAEPTLSRTGDKRIIVELPGVQDPRQAAEVIGRTAQLTFHPVKEAVPASDKKAKPGKGEVIIPDEGGQRLRLGPAGLTGEGVGDAKAGLDQQMGAEWQVSVDFKGDGERKWVKLTGDAACERPGDPRRRVAIVLDDKVISSPQVDPSVACDVGITGGSTQITGQFSDAEAKDLAALIQGGALPVPVDVIEQRTVGPTLGADAIKASGGAAVIGVVATALFIAVVYRLVGGLAAISLACYAVLSYAALVLLGATLTLPGLAGFVLAIGMAVDANVLIFERAREEYARSKRMLDAFRVGTKQAWSAIVDSNVTTLLAAGLLFYLASGPVKGFGVTLAIGVFASMVSALLIARVLVEFALRRKVVQRHPKVTGLHDIGGVRRRLLRRNPDLMRRGRMWLVLSGVIALVALAGIAVRGVNLGVEFTGGRLVEYATSTPVKVEQAREAVSDAGFPRAVVQTSDQNIAVRTENLTNNEVVHIQSALEKVGGDVTKERDEKIGPSLGVELLRNALVALGLALAAQLAYLAVRFRWSFAVGAIIGMFHVVLVILGLFAWMGKTLDGVFLAALMTVIGYAVNDTVVVLDRVREEWGANRTGRLPAMMNSAILHTLPRTFSTGMGATFILAALAILGGDSLTDFALAVLAGIVVGHWSTVFTTGPLTLWLERFSKAPPPMPKKQAKAGPDGRPRPKRPTPRDRDSGAVV
jgi:SecD/SecF fusion protein